MSNILKLCCVKDPIGSSSDNLTVKMDKVNGHGGCPVTGDSAKVASDHKSVKPNLRIKVPQPVRLRNYMNAEETFDNLSTSLSDAGTFNTSCTEKVCLTSLMNTPGRGDVPRTPAEVYEEAQAFFTQYFASIKRENSEAHKARLEEVKRDLDQHGTYQLKNTELTFGVKLAWRNATRCIGRIQWKKLQVFDCREVTTATGMFEALCNHIKYATNKGNIRSAITIFPQRTDGKHDYRIWNPQLLSYAGYVQPDGSILGDPMRVEFTEICIKLGWKSTRTAFDILPLVLSADGKNPEFFNIPEDIIMQVQIEHPNYDWFKELGIKWYVLPAVSNMRLDCGGLEFTGTAFNGWYMSTEIGCRNLCDVNRRNITEKVAQKMKLDTSSPATLWQDRVLVEVNIAVLHSFHKVNASIVDHHSASEQFMKHLETEMKTRGGCPSDWVWIVPPMSGSLTPVFHQEMALYHLRPSYDYQENPWKSHLWHNTDGAKPAQRKFHFKQIARAVKFTSKLFGRALSKRIKATILYATETGKSEHYAKELGTIFGHAFNVQVQCMADYDMFSIEHETLLLIVTSTFGNGEPPANGVVFANHLFEMLYNEKRHHGDFSGDSTGSHKVPTPKSLMRTNSVMSPKVEYKRQLTRLESNKSSTAGASSVEHIGPLSNVRYAVFGLGSSAYPKFCNFGLTVDKILYELGGERILEIACGDELIGMEQQFHTWSSKIFHVACEIFCLDDNEMVKDAKKAIHTSIPLTEDTVRFSKTTAIVHIKDALESSYKKGLVQCTVKENKPLGSLTLDRSTVFVSMEPDNVLQYCNEITYVPGDHVGIMACNRKETVDSVLSRCKDANELDKPVKLQVQKETLTPTGAVKAWEPHERIPTATIREIFTRFLDITTPPSMQVWKYLARCCTEPKDTEKIKNLIEDSNRYDDWRHLHYPHLGEVLALFPSCKPQASMLAALLPPLQPRFYSISSSPLAHPNRVHVTVAVVTYSTQYGNGSKHYGVCSTYLQGLKPGDKVFVFIKSAPTFHMPKDISAPIIMVGPGSGIAPFRGFWNQRRWQLKYISPSDKQAGPMWLFFGCRYKNMDLYKDEKDQAVRDGVLTKSLVAYSREECKDKKYVQDLLEEEGEALTRMLLKSNGHFYVCGDCKMAEEVQHKLKSMIQKHAKMSDVEVDDFLLNLMDENRYHEDIFGITLRTAEVHTASRDIAKRTRQVSHSQLD